ncbi:MiaB/RimO family radical SAM methylthiotransferase [Candidatus Gracilibacteria bacterium]|nr:MiaB/RimO family radical SAM methylthiotransferase [Candidatus Gracilibacteria bacterium]NUJ98933.1 MiaB/RimO family radical SAM methylthiotransferase [Candidatus Gracilibacteria bacterium]
METKVFGCKVNKYYTDLWLKSDFLKDKRGIFIASCVVTDKAKKKWIKFVKQNISKLQEDEKIFISGCGALKKGEKDELFFETYNELNDWREKIVLLGEAPKEEQKEEEKQENKSLALTKKFIVIQGGCDSFCTFCLTVQKRGAHFSRQKEAILKDILAFEKRGGKEVVLTGINLSAWGMASTNDIGKSRLGELLHYILENTSIPRIRISSLGPEFIDDTVLEIFAKKRIYPHFHLSLQSSSDTILKSMARHYDKKYIETLLQKITKIQREDRVKISIGADIIVGFPGETEDDFIETCELIQKYTINKVHCFPFSAHNFGETVPASFFPDQVNEKIKNERQKRLLSLAEKIRNEFIQSQKGKEFNVLVEKVAKEKFEGWTENYIEINEKNFVIKNGEVKKNTIITGTLI